MRTNIKVKVSYYIKQNLVAMYKVFKNVFYKEELFLNYLNGSQESKNRISNLFACEKENLY